MTTMTDFARLLRSMIDGCTPSLLCPTDREGLEALLSDIAAPKLAGPIDDLAPDARAWLIDQMGMQGEMVGGGCYVLRHDVGERGHLWITGADGSGMPDFSDWMVGAYLAHDPIECAWDARSTDTPAPLTLRQAVGMGRSFLVNAEPVAATDSGAFYIIGDADGPSALRETGPYASYNVAERCAEGMRRIWASHFYVEKRDLGQAQFPTPGEMADELADALEDLLRATMSEDADCIGRATYNAEALLSRLGVKLEA